MHKNRTTNVLRKLNESGLKLTHEIMQGRQPGIYSDNKRKKYVIRLTSKTLKKVNGKSYPIYYLRFGGLPEKVDYLLLALFDGTELTVVLKVPTKSIVIENNEISADLDPAYMKQAIWVAPEPLSATA